MAKPSEIAATAVAGTSKAVGLNPFQT